MKTVTCICSDPTYGYDILIYVVDVADDAGEDDIFEAVIAQRVMEIGEEREPLIRENLTLEICWKGDFDYESVLFDRRY